MSDLKRGLHLFAGKYRDEIKFEGDSNDDSNFESFNLIKHLSYSLAVINACPMLVSSVNSDYSFTDLGRMDS